MDRALEVANPLGALLRGIVVRLGRDDGVILSLEQIFVSIDWSSM